MIRCDAKGCVRGVVHRGDFGEMCKFCLGKGAISLGDLACNIGECESTLRKLLRPHRAMRASVCARIVEKITEVTG